jgi:hypothetical protein
VSAKSVLRFGSCLVLFVVLPFVFLSCPSTTTPKTYPRIVIDTYKPQGGGVGVDTFITLFDASGDPTTDTSPDLWNDNNSPYTVDAPPISIAEDDNGNPIFSSYARIDYTGGLTSGIYYIRVRCQTSTDLGGPYAIRVVEYVDTGGDINAQYPEGFFVSNNNSDTPYETDDNPASGGIPTSPITIGIGDRLNRYLTAGDVDWFKLVLP